MKIINIFQRITPNQIISINLAESTMKRLEHLDAAAYSLKMSEYHEERIKRLSSEKAKLLELTA